MKFGKYLSPYVDHPKDKALISSKIFTKVYQKLPGWKAKMQSQTSKLTLCNAILQVLSICHISITLLPKSTLQKIEAFIRKFWWQSHNQRNEIHLIY